MRFLVIMAALALPTSAWCAAPSFPARQVGDIFEIRHEYQSEDQTDDGSSSGSSGSNHDRRASDWRSRDGLELEYDFPKDSTEEDRSREWQFPAHIFRPFRGAPQLLNRADLEARIDVWLKRWKIGRETCGKWIFTWNAFKIECDPQSVITSLEQYNLWVPELAEGTPYRTPQAREAAPLKRLAGSIPASFVAQLIVDPDKLRQEQAEADVIVSQMIGKPQTLDEALRARSSETASGSVIVTFDTDGSGRVRQRTEVVKLTIRGPDGKVETKRRTEKVERRRLGGPN
ncbi:MAG: hypothetical protein M3Q57_09650 [Pseudomonadota bacterium]|nr:hypothetical protein [Pseudomonadota bacterium]